jgi:hypothetical protein
MNVILEAALFKGILNLRAILRNNKTVRGIGNEQVEEKRYTICK